MKTKFRLQHSYTPHQTLNFLGSNFPTPSSTSSPNTIPAIKYPVPGPF